MLFSECGTPPFSFSTDHQRHIPFDSLAAEPKPEEDRQHNKQVHRSREDRPRVCYIMYPRTCRCVRKRASERIRERDRKREIEREREKGGGKRENVTEQASVVGMNREREKESKRG